MNVSEIRATDTLVEVPTAQWWDLLEARRHFAKTALPYDCRCLLQFCDDADLMYEQLGFDSPETLIQDGLGLKPPELRLVVEWLRLNPQDDAVAFETAKEQALLAHGGDRRSEEFQLGNTKLKPSASGMTAPYIIARLERDRHHKLAADVRAGRLSANAAAVQAGYRERPSPLEIALRQIPKLNANERELLRRALTKANVSVTVPESPAIRKPAVEHVHVDFNISRPVVRQIHVDFVKGESKENQ
jgi:hypothetical protein